MEHVLLASAASSEKLSQEPAEEPSQEQHNADLRTVSYIRATA